MASYNNLHKIVLLEDRHGKWKPYCELVGDTAQIAIWDTFSSEPERVCRLLLSNGIKAEVVKANVTTTPTQEAAGDE